MPVSRRRPLPHVIRRGDRGLFDLDPEFSNPARRQQAFNLGLPDCGVPLCQTSRCRRKLFVEGYSVGCAGVYLGENERARSELAKGSIGWPKCDARLGDGSNSRHLQSQ